MNGALLHVDCCFQGWLRLQGRLPAGSMNTHTQHTGTLRQILRPDRSCKLSRLSALLHLHLNALTAWQIWYVLGEMLESSR